MAGDGGRRRGRRAAGAPRPARAWRCCCVFPVALFLYLSVQSRFFGRWLLPVYPMLALLAGRRARARRRGRARAARPRLAGPGAGARLRRRALPAARGGLPLDGGARPPRHARDRAPIGSVDPAPRACASSSSPPCPTAGSGRRAAAARSGRPTGPSSSTSSSATPQEAHVEYTGDAAARRCWTATAPRATAPWSRWTSSAAASRPTARPAALAYYARLERESDLVFAVSPYRADAEPPPFSFDLSYSYYSPAYERPGPEVRIYRLARLPPGRTAAGRRVSAAARPSPGAAERRASAALRRPRRAGRHRARRRGRPARRARRCGCGTSTTACPSPTTPTRPSTSSRGRSRCSTARWTRATTRTRRPSRTSSCSSSTSAAATWRGPSRPTPSRPSSPPASSSRSWGRSGWRSRSGPARGSTTGASGWSPPRCWRSPSCRSSTPSTRSTTS